MKCKNKHHPNFFCANENSELSVTSEASKFLFKNVILSEIIFANN